MQNEDDVLHTQNEDHVLKYNVNEATLLLLHLKTKITATDALDGQKKLWPLGKVKEFQTLKTIKLHIHSKINVPL